jgi:hypothetical protein
MDQSSEDLDLVPDLSRLSIEVRDLIRNGASRNGHVGWEETAMAVCIELLQAGYGAAEIWMIMTEPANAIAEEFFSKDGEQAEAYLERIVSEAYKLVDRSERDDE